VFIRGLTFPCLSVFIRGFHPWRSSVAADRGKIARIASLFRDRRIAVAYAGLGCTITLLHAALSAKTIGHFSSDSWSYFELSQSVFTHFYRVATVRQFSFDAPFGVSFPPLLPILIAAWNAVANSGVYAGTWINLIVAALTFPALLVLGRTLSQSDAPGILAMAALLGSPWYLDEVMGGRAIPIAVLLFAVMLLLLHRALTATARVEWLAAAAGVAAGLVFEVRFDFLLPAVVIGGAMAAGQARAGTRLAAAYFAGLAVAVLPWVVYSVTHFGVPLASDNTRTATAVAPLLVTRFVPFPETITTLRNEPFEWIAAKIYGSWTTIEALAIAVGASPIPVLAGMWVATWTEAPKLPRPTTMVLTLAWLALGTQIAVTAASGYPDVRFWIPIAAFGTFTMTALLLTGREIPHLAAASALLFVPAQVALVAAASHQPDRLAGIFSALWPLALVAFVAIEPAMRTSRAVARLGRVCAVAIPLVALMFGSALAVRSTGARYSFTANATARTRDANARIVEGLDGSDPARARILLADVPGAPIACEFGARTSVGNVLKPAPPFGWIDLWLLVRRYGITHAAAGDPEIDARLPVLFAVHKSANGALWTIEGERQGMVVVEDARPADSIPGLKSLLVVTNAGGPVDASHAPARAPDDWPYPLLFVPRP